jgi:thiamine monophosphate synthase
LAIGGITVENRPLLGESMGLAVSSTLCGAEDPAAVARRLLG